MKAADIRVRILAVIVGAALVFVVGAIGSYRPSFSQSLLIVIRLVSYGLIGGLLGFIWPGSGWRLGLYLFAVWPLYILVVVFFSDPPTRARLGDELMGLIGVLLVLPVSSIGSWLGSLIRRRTTNTATESKAVARST